jgi:hypothetical protein
MMLFRNSKSLTLTLQATFPMRLCVSDFNFLCRGLQRIGHRLTIPLKLTTVLDLRKPFWSQPFNFRFELGTDASSYS